MGVFVNRFSAKKPENFRPVFYQGFTFGVIDFVFCAGNLDQPCRSGVPAVDFLKELILCFPGHYMIIFCLKHKQRNMDLFPCGMDEKTMKVCGAQSPAVGAAGILEQWFVFPYFLLIVKTRL